ncbi:MAG: hypothetical protein HY013_12770, partial [Candidatus Solibacter usitatus]|nr:hypothetical protein [Candidatus Solibacter usitatus]
VEIGGATAAVSPEGALALVARDGGLALLRLDTGEATRIEGALADADRLAFSADGLTAAAYSGSSRRVQILRDLRTTPAADPAVDVSSLDGTLSALAAGGAHAVLAMTGGVYAVAGDAVTRIAEISGPVAVEIAPNGRDLFVAGRQRIVEVRDFAATASLLPFAEIADPVGIQIAAGGKRLLIASARGIDAFDIATHAAVGHLDLDFTPTRMEAAGRLALLNTGSAQEPLYVLDENFIVSFVPAGREQ